MATLISTPAQLQAINSNLTGQFELANDIDMSGINFTVIGDGSTSAKRFKGIFDGKGFKIKNLKINKTTANIGLFGFTENATIKNVGLENCEVNGTSATNYVGAIVGYAYNTLIEQCYSTGSVFGQYGVGGIIGWNAGSSLINSWSSCSTSGKGRIGGLVGNLVNVSSFITNSYCFGLPYSSETAIPASALVGSLGTGVSATNVVDSYYNSDVFNFSVAGNPLTTSQFADSSNFSSWDSNIWGYGSYPYLKLFGLPATPAQNITVTLNSHSGIAKQLLDVSKRVVRVNVSHSKQLNSFNALELIKNANVNSHIEQIVSNVVVLKNANVKSYQVTSYLDEIGSEITRVVTTQRILQSHVNPIDSVIVVDIPVRTEIPVFAEVFLLSSQSEIEYLLGQTLLADKHNQSATTKILNQSTIYTTENRTEMEVN